MNIAVEVAEALAAQIAGATLSVPVTVRRSYVLVSDRAVLSGVTVTIAPYAVEQTAADLKRWGVTWRIGVWVQAPCTPDAVSVDPLLDLCQELCLLFPPGTELGTSRARLVGVEQSPAFDPRDLDAKRMFTAPITFTFLAKR